MGTKSTHAPSVHAQDQAPEGLDGGIVGTAAALAARQEDVVAGVAARTDAERRNV